MIALIGLSQTLHFVLQDISRSSPMSVRTFSRFRQQSTPDPAFESPTEPLRGELQRLHALRHQNSDVLRAVQISPEVTAKSCPYPTYQQAGLLTVLRSNSDP